jgi:hypothetical protein
MAATPIFLYNMLMEHLTVSTKHITMDMINKYGKYDPINPHAIENIIMTRASEMAFVVSHELTALTLPSYKKALGIASQLMLDALYTVACGSFIDGPIQTLLRVDFVEMLPENNVIVHLSFKDTDVVRVEPYTFSQQHFMRNFMKHFYEPVNKHYVGQGFSKVEVYILPDLSRVKLCLQK